MGLGFFQMQCRACAEKWNDYWCSVSGAWHMPVSRCPRCGSEDLFNTGIDPFKEAKDAVQGQNQAG